MTRRPPPVRTRWLAPVLAALLGVAAPGPLHAAAAAPAEQPVARLYESLRGVTQQADAIGYEGRAERLAPVIRASYDLPFMSAKVLGRHWRGLSEEEQRRWVDTFSRLTIATYADRFDAAGVGLEVLGSEPSARETVLVRTHILPPDDEPVAVDYRTQEKDGDWRIVDVYLNGTVSELALRRSEYSEVIQRDGFQSLVETLERRIADPVDDAETVSP